MLEFLLTVGCAFGNTQSCEKGLQAYGEFSGIRIKAEEYGKKYPVLANTVAVVGFMKERKVFYKLQGNWYHDLQIEDSNFKNTLIYRLDF
jgi:hypothetical protein